MRRGALVTALASACATHPRGGSPPPPTASSPAECAGAEALLHEVGRFMEAGRPTCASSAVRDAVAACPALAPRLDARMSELGSKLTTTKPARLAVSPEGRFALQEVGRETRIFDLRGDTPNLAYRLEERGGTFLSDAMLGVEVGVDLAVVHLERGTVEWMAQTRLVGTTDAHVYLATADRIVRLDASDSGRRAEIALDPQTVLSPGAVAEAGGVVVLPNAVVTFDPSRVVTLAARAPSISEDRRWVALCDGETQEVVLVRAADGAIMRRAPVRGPITSADPRACERTGIGRDPSGRSWVWFASGPAGDEGPIQVAVMDAETGRVRRFEDPSATWHMLAEVEPFFDPTRPDRICARYRGSGSTQTSESCHLSLGGARTHDVEPRRAPRRAPRQDLARVVRAVPGSWATATSPSGHLAALSARVDGRARIDVRLTLIDQATDSRREVLLPGARYEGPLGWAPWLYFYDDEHLLVHGEDVGPTFVVERARGEVTALGMASLEGRVLRLGEAGVFDPRSWKREDLATSERSWARAPVLIRDHCLGP